jgi:hypothetical protein
MTNYELGPPSKPTNEVMIFGVVIDYVYGDHSRSL